MFCRRFPFIFKAINKNAKRNTLYLGVKSVCPMCTMTKEKKNDEKILSEKTTSVLEQLKKKIIEDAPPPPPIESQSLIKGLMVDKIDDDMLVYPEFEDTADLEDVNAFAAKIERLFFDKVNSKEIDLQRKIPDDVIENLKTLGLYGIQVPKEFGGLNYSNKAMLRIYEELGRDWSVYSNVACHNDLVVKAILLHGNEEQKRKYLPLLASGKMTGAFCLHEDSCGQDMSDMQTTARLVDGQLSKILLYGKKTWITNGANADLLIVFAKLKGDDSENMLIPSTAFIVERKPTSGVVTVNRQNTIGLKGVEISDLEFDKVEVNEESILGGQENGYNVAMSTIRSNRYAFAAAAAASLRRLLAVLVEHCNATKRWGMMLNDSNLIRTRMAEIALNIFSIETAAYYIAGRLDEDSSKDFAVESAVVLREARRALRHGIITCMDVVGAKSLTTDMEFERVLRDVIVLFGFMSSDDYLTGYIAMECLKIYGQEWKTVLHKGSNHLTNPWDVLKERFFRGDLWRDSYKIKHYIYEKQACRYVEETMAKFEHAFKFLLFRYGKALEEEDAALDRIAEILSNLFLMISVISRASRSYSIGLNQSGQELGMAHAICQIKRTKCINIVEDFKNTENPFGDDLSLHKIGDDMLRLKGYKVERPIQRNW